MFALILTLITTPDLNRLIRAIFDEREAVHAKMIGADLQALISPLSDEWADLSVRYAMLADMSDEAYAELLHREAAAIQARKDEASTGKTSPNGTRYCRTCGFSDCPGISTGDCPRFPARGQAGNENVADYRTDLARGILDA